MFTTMGYSPGLLFKTRPIFDPYEFTLNRHKQSRKQSQIILEWFLQAFQRVWSDFQDLPKSAMFKTMGYSPGFFAQNRPIFDPYQSTLNRHKHPRKESQIIFRTVLAGVSESLERFPGLAKIGHVQTMGYSPGFLLKIGQFSTAYQSTLNQHKHSRKQSQIILERLCVLQAFQRVWSDI